MPTEAPLTTAELSEFAANWYRLLDVHAPIEQLLPLLADADLEMRFPEGTQRGHAGFRSWYETVTRRFFDEAHTVTSVEPGPAAAQMPVKVVVNWQAKIWDPPAANSQWLGFDAYQTWLVRRSPDTGGPVIVTYIVDGLTPMPGSPDL